MTPFQRAIGSLAAVTVIGSLIGGTIYQSSQPASTAGTANLWIDTTGGSCTRSSSPAAYSDSAACGSLAAAYSAATTGDTIGVENGTYGDQSLTSGTKTLTFVGQSEAGVVFGQLLAYVPNVSFQQMTFKWQDAPASASVVDIRGSAQSYDHVTVDAQRNANVEGVFMGYGTAIDHISWTNSEIKNTQDAKDIESNWNVSYITLDHDDIHDNYGSTGSVHTECYYSQGNHQTITNDHFWNCYTMDINFTCSGCTLPPSWSITLQNDVFEQPQLGRRRARPHVLLDQLQQLDARHPHRLDGREQHLRQLGQLLRHRQQLRLRE